MTMRYSRGPFFCLVSSAALSVASFNGTIMPRVAALIGSFRHLDAAKAPRARVGRGSQEPVGASRSRWETVGASGSQ